MKKTYLCPQAKEITVKLEGLIATSPGSLTSTTGNDAQNEGDENNNLSKEDFGW